ncbi:hypothetical protein ACFYO9_19855 [Streptomyces sp. NPDC005863]|uniref:hypothetical protein n=1 Tax=unclassified Streptomyces TaxID=2593676 RepID=UPI0033E197B9
MDTATLLLLGAAGGAVRGIVHAYDCMTEWLARRREHRLSGHPEGAGPPAFGAFYDIAGECVAAAVHITLGAGVAVLLGASGQISGGFATFAAGASAPLVLVQLKNSRLADVVLGDAGAAQAGQPVQPVQPVPPPQGEPQARDPGPLPRPRPPAAERRSAE